ncbi:MAG TPA: hypothetical protein ENK41_00840, partial [Rhodobacteraceae bacterium]|nr:hypothetical protein [Paracoccaceae bacterium]
MSVGQFAFLPNLRSAAAAEAARDGVRLRLEYDLEIIGDGAAQGDRVPVGAELKGPGDVIGLDAGQITRVEPEEANRGFEPNYFPFIEFRDPDLPWRYSLETGNPDRLRPWFVLIALKGEEFTFLDQGSALAPRIEVASVRDSLPDLNQAWASAIVQVDMGGTSGDPALALLSDPGRGFSRIYAHRKLEADTQYTLFLVPSTRAGRDAALTGSVDAGAGNDLAWEHGASAALILPYYFRHTFRTDPGQDLERLLR